MLGFQPGKNLEICRSQEPVGGLKVPAFKSSGLIWVHLYVVGFDGKTTRCGEVIFNSISSQFSFKTSVLTL